MLPKRKFNIKYRLRWMLKTKKRKFGYMQLPEKKWEWSRKHQRECNCGRKIVFYHQLSSANPYHIVLYHTTPYHTVPYHNIPYYATQYHTISCETLPYHIIQHHTINILFHTMLYHNIPNHTIPNHIMPHHTILCDTITIP